MRQQDQKKKIIIWQTSPGLHYADFYFPSAVFHCADLSLSETMNLCLLLAALQSDPSGVYARQKQTKRLQQKGTRSLFLSVLGTRVELMQGKREKIPWQLVSKMSYPCRQFCSNHLCHSSKMWPLYKKSFPRSFGFIHLTSKHAPVDKFACWPTFTGHNLQHILIR